MAPHLQGFTPYKKDDADRYNQRGWWAGLTYGDILDKAANIHPDKEALVDQDTRFTYSQVQEKANKLAIGFLELGIKPLDRVLLQIPNWYEFIFSFFVLQCRFHKPWLAWLRLLFMSWKLSVTMYQMKSM